MNLNCEVKELYICIVLVLFTQAYGISSNIFSDPMALQQLMRRQNSKIIDPGPPTRAAKNIPGVNKLVFLDEAEPESLVLKTLGNVSEPLTLVENKDPFSTDTKYSLGRNGEAYSIPNVFFANGKLPVGRYNYRVPQKPIYRTAPLRWKAVAASTECPSQDNLRAEVEGGMESSEMCKPSQRKYCRPFLMAPKLGLQPPIAIVLPTSSSHHCGGETRNPYKKVQFPDCRVPPGDPVPPCFKETHWDQSVECCPDNFIPPIGCVQLLDLAEPGSKIRSASIYSVKWNKKRSNRLRRDMDNFFLLKVLRKLNLIPKSPKPFVCPDHFIPKNTFVANKPIMVLCVDQGPTRKTRVIKDVVDKCSTK